MAIQTHIRAPLLLLAAIATAAASLSPEWRVVSTAKGVTTRARIDATSQLRVVHGEAVVEASVAVLMSVFGDLDQHGHWDATLVAARVDGRRRRHVRVLAVQAALAGAR